MRFIKPQFSLKQLISFLCKLTFILDWKGHIRVFNTAKKYLQLIEVNDTFVYIF